MAILEYVYEKVELGMHLIWIYWDMFMQFSGISVYKVFLAILI